MSRRDPNAAILPGACIGILGEGQLGRMLALAARQMDYRVAVFSSVADAPAAAVADFVTVAPYDDFSAVETFARRADVVTYEFENVPMVAAQVVNQIVPVRPGIACLETSQNRIREKSFLAARGFPVAPFVPVRSELELAAAIATIGLPAVLKTADSGYDGKGQRILHNLADAEPAYAALSAVDCVLEAFVPFVSEVSVVGARDVKGNIADYGVIQNHHANHILDISVAGGELPLNVAEKGAEIAHAVLRALDVVGVLCVEFFVKGDGTLLINELAPRPHNSGHLTIEACPTSQFEQQLRTVCGLPLGATDYRQPAAMANLLGDLWADGEPNWANALILPDVHLHLYGKADAKPGRKMGHLTALARTVWEAEATVRNARARLTQIEGGGN